MIAEGSSWTIEFTIENVPQAIRLPVEDQLVIGRVDPDKIVFDGLDLTPFRGKELGVSRQHAIIRWHDEQLVIADQHSINGTTLNNQRLEPEVDQRLKDGDDLAIGHMKMKIRINDELSWTSIRGRRSEFSLRKVPPPGNGQRVLVIEDDPQISELYRTILEKAGYTVQLCREVVSAIRALNVSTPSLIIADLMLPGVSGLELCRYIRRDIANNEIPLVVVSAGEKEMIQQALDAGADIFLGKPTNLQELLRIVGTLIHKSEQANPVLGTKQLSSTAAFDPVIPTPRNNTMVIFVESHREPISVIVAGSIILGRRMGDVVGHSQDHVDLASYGGFDKGVSRVHAKITRRDDTFLIEDLGSSNGTYVNGELLSAHSPHLITSGNELRLGELRMVIYLLREDAATEPDPTEEVSQVHTPSPAKTTLLISSTSTE